MEKEKFVNIMGDSFDGDINEVDNIEFPEREPDVIHMYDFYKDCDGIEYDTYIVRSVDNVPEEESVVAVLIWIEEQKMKFFNGETLSKNALN